MVLEAEVTSRSEGAPVQVGGVLGYQQGTWAVAAGAALDLLQRTDKMLRVKVARSRD